MECQCEKCKEACGFNPGWFLPGEAEKAAKLLGMTLQEFFDEYLGVNWWEADSEMDSDTFVLAPAITTMKSGEEYPSDPRGRCVFFEKGLCKIHAAKPHECAMFIHGEERYKANTRHRMVAEVWKEHQDQIEELLGHRPISKPFFGGDLFGLLFS